MIKYINKYYHFNWNKFTLFQMLVKCTIILNIIYQKQIGLDFK